jgi:hypothetical protein
MCGRASAPKETSGSEKESASAHRYLQWHGPSSFQPVNKTAVVSEVPRAKPTGHKKHVVGTERFGYGISFKPKRAIIDSMLGHCADAPLEVIHDLHRLQTRYWIVEPYEI